MNRVSVRIAALLSVLCLCGIGCAESQLLDSNGSAGKRNVIQNGGFRLEVNWCTVNSDRSAECEMTATSLTQDYKAGFAYPIMQDQSGTQFRMVPKDGTLGNYTMIAGEPYTLRYVNKDILPTTVESVRGLVGTWVYRVVSTNLKAGQFSLAFADIPEKPVPVVQSNDDSAVTSIEADWETVGLWTYDQTDGLRVPEGLVLKAAPGALGEHNWTHRIELKTHSQLRQRADRIVWPVYLSRSTKQVCVDAPYPSFSGYIDMPDDAFDGVYAFASCKGGAAP